MDEVKVDQYQKSAFIGCAFHAERITIFGFRARGDHRLRGDIDLAVYELLSDDDG